MKKIKFLLLVALFLILFFHISNKNKFVNAQECDPWSCQPCTGTQKCINFGFGNYQCAEGKREAESCEPFNICGECAGDLRCERGGFGTYICVPPGANPSDYACDPWTCQPCGPEQKCVNVGFGRYACQQGKGEGEGCQPLNLCGECALGLNCSRVGFGSYICLSPGTNPADLDCNPWTGQPCTSQGQVCVQISLGRYACQATSPPVNPSGSLGTTQICNFIPADNPERGKCVDCFAKPGVWTPFGCIETNPQAFVEKILRIAIGIAGGTAFLMIIYGAYVTMISAGNPEKLTEGREIITSAIAGLLLIVFSVVILRIIGVDILGIPGLG